MNAVAANPHAGVKAGKKRKPFRIKEWLSAQGTNQTEVANEVGVSKSIVSDTIRGTANNRRVLAHLRDSGCPKKYLSLPEDMEGEQ